MPKRVVYITEEQEREISRRIMSEALVVNSDQVSDIVNYLNGFFVPKIDYAGDVGTDGLPCSALEIVYTVNGQELQKLKQKELLDVVDNKFRGFVKDDASRKAYFSKVIDDWLKGKVQKTGQLTVNVISDKDINRFKKKNKGEKDNKKNQPE